MLQVFPTASSANFEVRPGPDWGQGFATYGGYVAASAYRAIRMAGHDRPLLSAQVAFLAPAPVDGYEVRVVPLRVGKGASQIEAQVWGAPHKNPDGEAVLTTKILFTLGIPRPASLTVRQTLAPEQLKTFQKSCARTANTPALPEIIPRFIQNFDYRPIDAGIPFSTHRQTHHAIAFRPRFAIDGTAAELLLLISDINPPPQLVNLTEPCPASTGR